MKMNLKSHILHLILFINNRLKIICVYGTCLDMESSMLIERNFGQHSDEQGLINHLFRARI